jgi:outer membrane usher protein
MSGGLSYSVSDSSSTASAYISKNAPAGEGVGMRAFVDRTEGPSGAVSTGGGALGIYRGAHGVYSFDYRRTNGANSYTFTASGGVALMNSSIYFSRPITDSYALVKVGGLQGVRVSTNNQVSGSTNRKGEIFVTGLASYYDNPVSIDSADIPVNYELREVRKYISTPVRGGAVVSFEAKKLQAFIGRFFIVKRGVKKSAEYWGFSIQAGDTKVRIVVGREGEFYLENVPTGTWPARLFQKGRECRFKMTIPESDDMMVDMEEVVCEMD